MEWCILIPRIEYVLPKIKPEVRLTFCICFMNNILSIQKSSQISKPKCSLLWDQEQYNIRWYGIWKCGRENKWKVPSFFSICRLQFSFRSRDCRRGSQKIKWLQDRSRNDVQLFRKCLVVHLSSFFFSYLFLFIKLLKHNENIYW